MVPPPVTPSPHRFVIKKPKEAPPFRQPPSVPGTQQFSATPRFHYATSQRSNLSDALYREEAPLAHQYSTPARPRDSIEDNSDEIDFDIYQSFEPIEPVKPNITQQNLSTDGDEDFGTRKRSLKRRRLSHSPILDSQYQVQVEQQYEHVDGDFSRDHNAFEESVSSANSTINSPPAEAPRRPPGYTTAPRFILPSTPAQVPSSTPATTHTATFVKPPRFRPPDEQEHQQRPSEPLPDAFSPQRRGQKFLAGGLAAEVLGWVMNLESSAPATSSTRLKDDVWVIELVVDDVRGGPDAGMTLISGRQIHLAPNGREGAMADSSGVVKVILAGSGSTEAFQRASKVGVGKKVRIKSPAWEVVIEGEMWVVAVTWEE